MAARRLSKSPAVASSTGRAASRHDHSESYIGVLTTTAARHADGSNPSRLVTYWEPLRIDGCLVVSAVASQRATRVLALDPRVTESSEWQSKPRAPTSRFIAPGRRHVRHRWTSLGAGGTHMRYRSNPLRARAQPFAVVGII